MAPSYAAPQLAELLEASLRNRSVESVLRGNAKKDSIIRRIHDIRHGKCERVSLRVADEICTAFGRPDWMQLLEV